MTFCNKEIFFDSYSKENRQLTTKKRQVTLSDHAVSIYLLFSRRLFRHWLYVLASFCSAPIPSSGEAGFRLFALSNHGLTLPLPCSLTLLNVVHPLPSTAASCPILRCKQLGHMLGGKRRRHFARLPSDRQSTTRTFVKGPAANGLNCFEACWKY